LLQRGSLCANEGAVGVDIAELVVDRHIGVLLTNQRVRSRGLCG
jgi:hypothetical protein